MTQQEIATRTTTLTDLGRASRTSVYLEPVLHDLINQRAAEMNMSYSTYVRRVLIKDIREAGLLTEDIIATLAGL